MNTAQKGSVRYIVFKEKGAWYAVALEFNIVEEAENPEAALFYLLEAIRGYVKSARKAKGRMGFALNQKSEKEYENLWNAIKTNKQERLIKSPYQVYVHGTQELARV